MNYKIVLKRIGKIVLYTLISLFLLMIGALLFLHTNYGKKIVKDEVQSYLQKKLQTKVIIGSVNYRLPKWIEINNVYIEDLRKDTLLFGEKIAVDLDMLKLIFGNTYIRKVELKNIFANIYRKEQDSLFNYQFIVDAFSGNKPAEPAGQDTAALKLTLKQLILNKIRLRFTDQFNGSDFVAKVDTFNVTLSRFQPDRLQFDITEAFSSGVDFFMHTYKNDTIINSKTDPGSSEYSLLVSGKNISLNNINVTIENSTNGMYYGNFLNHFSLSDAKLDLYNQKALLDTLVLDSSWIKYKSARQIVKSAIKDSANTSADGWTVRLNKIILNNNSIQFDDAMATKKRGLDFSHMAIKRLYLNTDDIFYSKDSIVAHVVQVALEEKSGFRLDSVRTNILYNKENTAINTLYIATPNSVIAASLNMNYNDVNQLLRFPEKTSITFKSINSSIAVSDLYYLLPSIEKIMPRDKFLNAKVSLDAQVNGTLKQLTIPYFQVIGLDGTVLNARAFISNVTDFKKMAYTITVFNTTLAGSDLQKFIANKHTSFPSAIHLNTSLKGTLKKSEIVVSMHDNSNAFRLAGAAVLTNINQPNALQYDVSIRDSRIERSLINSFLPKKAFANTIRMPALIFITGKAKGSMNSIQPNLILDGSYGKMTLSGYFNNFKNPTTADYDLLMTANHFKLGELLMQDSLIGDLTFRATAKGKGLDYKTMQSAINVYMQEAEFKKYNYKNITLDAVLAKGTIRTNGMLNDTNLQFNFTASANVQRQYPEKLTLFLQLDTAQLQPLYLHKDRLNASFNLKVNAANLDPDRLSFYALMDSATVFYKQHAYALDNIELTANSSANRSEIHLVSPFADVNATGSFSYNKIGASLIRYANRFYPLREDTVKDIPPQQVAFAGAVKPHPLITAFIDSLNYNENLTFKGKYVSQASDSILSFSANLPYLNYKNNRISNTEVDVHGVADQLNGVIRFDTLMTFNNRLYATKIDAVAKKDSIRINALIKDKAFVDQFSIGGVAVKKKDTYEFSLKDNLLLNYQKWQVSNDNKISYSPAGLLVNNFILQNKNEKIFAASEKDTANSPVNIRIENFDIKNITAFASKDTLFASGIMNGAFLVSDFDKKLPAFTGNMQIDQLQIQQHPVGTIKLFAEKKNASSIDGTIDLSGNDNKMTVKGNYFLNNDEKQFAADISIGRLSMKMLESFSKNNINRASGNINGQIALQGKFSNPTWNGELNFDSVRFVVTKLGTPYRIDNQKIDFHYPKISFNNFTIKDSADNALKLQGAITSTSLTSYNLGMHINAKNFILLNTQKSIANQFYGFAAANADVNIKGNTLSPDIEGNISLNNKTDATFVLPQGNTNESEASSVVRFIDKDTFAFNANKNFSVALEPKSNFANFLNYNLNIEVNKEAAITIVIDPATGDELKIQGDARLNAGVDPGGNIVLAGNYELSSGYYILNYQFLQRKFNLLSGSTIFFGGAPTDAQIDVNAEYIVNTSAKDLLGNEVASSDGAPNTFNQKIPFRVILHLKGTVKKPEISFDIRLPDKNVQLSSSVQTTVENKLAQLRDDVAATNKQVLSLLLLNRFISEQSADFFKGNESSSSALGTVASSSVSKFLVSALDEIANDLFKGVNIDLNLNSYEDYSSGAQQQKTDLQIAVTKRFLNDRISVTVGKNFGIEGDDANAKASQQKGANNLPDVTINYKLTPDGKYLFRAYKKSAFEVILDGYVAETGVSFVVTLDYDKFKELFKKSKKEKD